MSQPKPDIAEPSAVSATKFWLGTALIVHLALIATLRVDTIRVLGPVAIVTILAVLAIYLYREATLTSSSTRGDKWLGGMAMSSCFVLAGLALTRTSSWPFAAAIGLSLLALKLWITGGSAKTLLPLAVFLALLVRLPQAREQFLIGNYFEFIARQSAAVLDWWHVPSLVLGESVRTVFGEWQFSQGVLLTPGLILFHLLGLYVAIAARSRLWALMLVPAGLFWCAAADVCRIVLAVGIAHQFQGNAAIVGEIATVALIVLGSALIYCSDRVIQVFFAPMPVSRRHQPQPFVRFWNEQLAFGEAKVRRR